MQKTDTPTLSRAMFILAQEIQSPDGLANAAILEAARRLLELHSMAMAAAVEIEEHWEAHCDQNGEGPLNLLCRLSGKLPPSVYDAHIPDSCREIVAPQY